MASNLIWKPSFNELMFLALGPLLLSEHSTQKHHIVRNVVFFFFCALCVLVLLIILFLSFLSFFLLGWRPLLLERWFYFLVLFLSRLDPICRTFAFRHAGVAVAWVAPCCAWRRRCAETSRTVHALKDKALCS